MKKQILLAGLLALGAAAHADLLRVRALGGITTFTLADVNAALDKSKASYESFGMTEKKNTRASTGYMAGLEVASGLLIPLPFVEIAARGEIAGATSEYLYEGSGQFASNKSDLLLTNGLLGLVVGIDLPLTGLGLGLGAYGGYGYLVDKSTSASQIGLSSSASGAQYTGSAFVSELEAKLKYSLIPMVALDIFGGMRFANFASISDGNNTLKNSKGENLAFDMSGFNAGVGLTVGF